MLFDAQLKWRDKHNRAFGFIQGALRASAHTKSLSVEIEQYSSDVVAAWSFIMRYFNSGNYIWNCVLHKLKHVNNFRKGANESLEDYIGRIRVQILSYNSIKPSDATL